MKGKLLLIGFGPGSFEHITHRARQAIEESDVIIGYNTYVDLIRPLLTGQEIVRTGMTEEVSRAVEAVKQAELGKKVAVISSGDAGVYGMAGLVYEVLIEKGWTAAEGVEVETIPGISAINSCASLLGAPVMHDACTISLSDHLTPWSTIIGRVEAAARADFVIALYNPRSGRRTRQIVETQRMLLRYRSPQTPVGLVKSAYRERQEVVLTTLAEMLEHEIGMLTTVIIGNSATFVYDGLMITPRGYQRKYTLHSAEQSLKPHERLRKEAEPWALEQDEGQPAGWGEAWPTGRGEMQPAGKGAAHLMGCGDAYRIRQGEAQLLEGDDTHSAERSATRPASTSPLELAEEALFKLVYSRGQPAPNLLAAEALAPAGRPVADASGRPAWTPPMQAGAQELIFEVAVSPGVANKKMSPAQLLTLAQIAGEQGELEYTPHHYMILRVPTGDPSGVTERLVAEGFRVQAVGDVVTVKACDFCNGEKTEAIPYAEELHRKLAGAKMPKELHIAVNGCGMACYRASHEDIGIIYRKGKFDLFLGAKTTGSNAHTAQRVAEGIEPERIVETIESIVRQYRERGHPNERFFKFFKRVKNVEGFEHKEVPVAVADAAVCGD
ncbi:cobalt-precorrin-3B C(17)-methyltransferase [Gordoniibacillus kamchatkensis]|uniref:Cobalt-precorrin-3B C(17)-methyltransferase n=1 Tax=Gordoniibacillus kamchatkensis TaxID=1590651 RepID=A0ABR5ACF9_9BACL|nr:precorrin-3B C(17)-methyltransferase [Paenibacillus sp. VKM B-2647]KIL38646.1 cobalt-precorrin-3B C(17)-methyltransferase [Paenibacillus sp. VKM B-2647]